MKVKIDIDRFLGPEQAAVRADGEQIGHVTTAEYGSQMLSLGGVRLTGGSKSEGDVTCDTLLALCNAEPVELTIDGGAAITLQAGRAPDRRTGSQEERMRVGCGSPRIGMFAKQWSGHADEVIVVDDHITGVLTEHQAGRFLDMAPRRHPRARPPLHAGPLFPGRRARHRAGAAPTSPTRSRSSRRSTRRSPGRACAS